MCNAALSTIGGGRGLVLVAVVTTSLSFDLVHRNTVIVTNMIYAFTKRNQNRFFLFIFFFFLHLYRYLLVLDSQPTLSFIHFVNFFQVTVFTVPLTAVIVFFVLRRDQKDAKQALLCKSVFHGKPTKFYYILNKRHVILQFSSI